MAELAHLGPVPSSDGSDPEVDIARDMAKKAIWALPVALVVSFLIWGVDGVLSSAYAIAIVTANFLAAAFLTARAAKISVAVLGAVAMFGFLLRLAVVFVAFWLAKDASWMKVVPFGLMVVITHVGLLFWEMKNISASLAFPGLKPAAPAASPAARKES